MEIPSSIRKRVEYELANWYSPNSEARKRFEACKQKLDRELQSITDAIEASEKLTERDFNFRVHIQCVV